MSDILDDESWDSLLRAIGNGKCTPFLRPEAGDMSVER